MSTVRPGLEGPRRSTHEPGQSPRLQPPPNRRSELEPRMQRHRHTPSRSTGRGRGRERWGGPDHAPITAVSHNNRRTSGSLLCRRRSYGLKRFPRSAAGTSSLVPSSLVSSEDPYVRLPDHILLSLAEASNILGPRHRRRDGTNRRRTRRGRRRGADDHREAVARARRPSRRG